MPSPVADAVRRALLVAGCLALAAAALSFPAPQSVRLSGSAIPPPATQAARAAPLPGGREASAAARPPAPAARPTAPLADPGVVSPAVPAAHPGALPWAMAAALAATVGWAARLVRPRCEGPLQPLLMVSVAGASGVSAAEALGLWAKDGHVILDIRSQMEGSEGRIRSPNKGTIDVPLINASSAYDSALGKRVVRQDVNPRWLEEVRARIPKDARVIVMCSDGGSRTGQALRLLAADGYRHVIGLAGGYNKWNQLYDRQLKPRDRAAQASREAALKDPIPWVSMGSSGGSWQPPPPSPASGHSVKVVKSSAPTAEVRATSPSMYLDPAFQAATLAAFPARANATVEEARVLWKLGDYSLLDVRSEMEGREGRIRGPNKGSIDIPMFNAKSMYDSTLGKRVVTQEVNPQWLEQVKARFLKGAKIIVMCSDGTTRSTNAIDLLCAEGYSSLVLMRGGYNRWDQVFDRNLVLRSPQQQAAKAEWLDDPVEWKTWSQAVGRSTPPHRAVAAGAAPATRTVREVVSVGAYTDPAFQNATLGTFPARRYATVEEARVLWMLGGYSIVDLRSDLEGADGRIRGPNKGSVDIPMINARSFFDTAVGERVMKQEVNRQWLEQMKARFPRDAKVVLMCSDGTSRSSQALELLQEAGYTNLVVMLGGYRRWDQLFDRNLALRTVAQQQAKAAALDDPTPWWRVVLLTK